MKDWQENFEEFDETPDEYLEIPEVPWDEDIRKIEDLEIQQREIEFAEKYLEKEKILRNKVDTGEISVDQYDYELRPIRTKSATRCGLETVGITYDHLGDVAENQDLLIAGNLEVLDQKERIKETIEIIGEDAAQELADRRRRDENLSEKGHELISRQVRIHGK